MLICLTVLILLCLLQACTHLNQTPMPTPDNLPQPAKHYSINMTGANNTSIRAHIYQPKLPAFGQAPVVIQLHAFAIAGTKSPKSLSAHFMYSSKTAMQLWEQGYWVISPDLRGHGSSKGTINLADPKQEIQDMIQLINWAEQHLPRVSLDANKRLKVGLIGDSYGAGVSLLTSIKDDRIKAIVSATGWYDLNDSLAPKGVPKIGWLKTPVLTGHFFNPGKLSPVIDQFYKDAVNARPAHAYQATLAIRSPSYYCRQNQRPQANVLLLQGMKDILFDFQQGVLLAECIKQGGRDAHLIGIQEGHLQPFTQWGGRYTFYHIEDQVHCGEKRFNTSDMAIHWFDQHLKQQVLQDTIPELCITLDYEQGRELSSLPEPNNRFIISSTPNQDSNALGPATSADQHKGWLTPKSLVSYIGRPWSNGHQPLVIPLTHITGKQDLIGTPRYTLALDLKQLNMQATPQYQPYKLFFGLAILDGDELTMINDQLAAISLSDPLQKTLHMDYRDKTLGIQLQPGQTLGFVAYAYRHRTPLRGPWWQDQIQISGRIDIPILDSSTWVSNSMNHQHNP